MGVSKEIKCRDIIRYRLGRTALMRVEKMDDLCGYTTYHGIHICGEQISIPHSDKCRIADKSEVSLFESFRSDRHCYSMGDLL